MGKKDPHYKIVNTDTGEGYQATLMYRDDINKENWEEYDSFEFTYTLLPDILEDGDQERSPKGYGYWKLLNERTSSVKAIDKFEAMRVHLEAFQRGQWKPEGSARKGTISALLVQAVVSLNKKKGKEVSFAAIEKLLSGMDAEALKTFRNKPAIISEMARLKKEQPEVSEQDLESLFDL